MVSFLAGQRRPPGRKTGSSGGNGEHITVVKWDLSCGGNHADDKERINANIIVRSSVVIRIFTISSYSTYSLWRRSNSNQSGR